MVHYTLVKMKNPEIDIHDYSCMDTELTKNRYSDYLADCENDQVKPCTYSEFLKKEYDYWGASIFRG